MTDTTDPQTGDLAARLEATLTERFTELGNPYSRMRIAFQGPDGWPASEEVGPHDVAGVLRELLAAEPAAPPPPTDRAGLRARVAEALLHHLERTADIRPSRSGDLAFMPEVTDEERMRIADAVLRRLAAGERDEQQAQQGGAETRPTRGDQFEQWLKTQRDAAVDYPEAHQATDGLLDLYRLHADTGTPLDQHACEGRMVGDCECLEQPVKKPPMDPVHILGIEADEPACTCASAGDAFVPAGHYADCPSPEARQQHGAAAPVAGQPPADTGEEARTVCVCSHTKGEHITVSGRLLCDSCDPDSTENLVCKEFEAL